MKKQLQHAAAWSAATACAVLMSGCATSDGHRLIPLPWPRKGTVKHDGLNPALPPAGSGRGGYYQGDGPGANPPPNLDLVPDAEFKIEPYAKYANRPYSVFGQTYTPLMNDTPYTQQGIASWYGVKFHGQRTSSGEPYDMYKMTAAHPTLPIPSYARITSLETGKQVVVRINDRGPFHSNRLIDVSYTAALKLGLLGKGSNKVQVDRIMAPDPARIATLRREAGAEAATAPAEITTLMLEDRMAIESAALVAPAAPATSAAPAYRAATPAAAADPAAPAAPIYRAATPAAAAAPASPAAPIYRATTPAPAASAAPVPAPAPAPPVASEAAAVRNGYYLQLGAYGRAGGADDVRTRLTAAGIDNASLDVVQAGSVYRLFRGPFATRSEAEEAMRDLPTALALKPLIIKR